MIVDYKNIPLYNAKQDKWEEVSFNSQEEFGNKLDSLFSDKCEYHFDETSLHFNTHARFFDKNGYYHNLTPKTKEWIEWWDFEKLKCTKGVFFKNGDKEWYLPREYYDWLNFLKLANKEQDGAFTFPYVLDIQYHLALYEKRAECHNKHSILCKRRQMASSLYHCAKLYNRYCFNENSVNKIFASNETYLTGENGIWKFFNGYKEFRIESTAWKRYNLPDQDLNWIQRREYLDAGGNRRYKGTNSTLTGISTRVDATKGVGGYATYGYHEEGGIAPKLDKTYRFFKAAIETGNRTTGMFIAAGSVGDLTQCIPLKNYMYAPEENGFLGVNNYWNDKSGKPKVTGLYIPEHWGLVGFIDKYGNSKQEEALKYLLEKYSYMEKSSSVKKEEYYTEISQHPIYLEDAFRHRKVGEFPTDKLQRQQERIKERERTGVYGDGRKKPIKCLLTSNDKGEVVLTYSDLPTEHEYPIKANNIDKRGVVTIYELPEENPKMGTYFGGLDPIEVDMAEYVENKVFTPNGRKKIKDLKIGDYVIGVNGKKLKVKGVFPQGKTAIYKVSFSDKTSILVSDNHIWSVRLVTGDKKEYVQIRTCHLIDKLEKISYLGKGFNKNKEYEVSTYYKTQKGVNRWKIPIVQPIHFENNYKLKIDPYVLGCLLGDGGMTQNSIKFTSADIEIIDSLIKYSNNLYKIKKVNSKTNKYDYVLTSFKKWKTNELVKELKNLNLFGKGSKDKFIPDIYKYSTIEERVKIIQGLMDTDGYRGKTKHSQLVTTSERLADDLIEIVQSLGGICKKSKRAASSKINYINNKTVISKLDVFNVFISLPKEFIPFRLKRKKDRYKSPENITRVISNIEFERYDESLCISVDSEDGLYVTENGIVTHNTTTSDSIASLDIIKKRVEVEYKDDKTGKIEKRIEGGKLVATYRGRFNTVEETNEQMWLLIKLYNAFVLVERNKPNFINYMKRNGRANLHLAREKDIPLFKEESLNSAYKTESPFGFNKGSNTTINSVWKYFKDFVKEYFQEEFGFIYKTDGSVLKTFTGIDKVDDYWLLEELIQYDETNLKNFDRLISFFAAISLWKIKESNSPIEKIKYTDKTEQIENQPVAKRINFLDSGSNNYSKQSFTQKPKRVSLI